MVKKFLAIVVAALALAGAPGAQRLHAQQPATQRYVDPKVTTQDVDWAAFLGKHDLVWQNIEPDYYAGAIMGNGLLGNNIYGEGDALRFHIGRVDVTEGRMPADRSQYNNLYHAARLPIGYFLLKPMGTMQSDDMRLDLWNATATGHIDTDRGAIAFKSYVHATRNIIVLETCGDGDFEWSWQPLKATSPRLVHGRTDYPREYIDHPNPPVRLFKEGDVNLSVQNLYGGKTYVVAWCEARKGDTRRIFMTITQEASEKAAVAAAEKTLKGAVREDAAKLEAAHRRWWHAWYPASHATFGDEKLEGFYWMQQYKFGCLTRPDGHIIDLQGPWAVENTPWPAIWLNLNIQLTYSPLFTANRAEMSRPVWRALNGNMQNLRDNAGGMGLALGRSSGEDLYRPLDPRGDKMLYEVGNLTWLLFYYYEYCTYMGDEKQLLENLYPLLSGAVTYYESIRERRDDGLWHLPATASPEYSPARDCNYDLSLLRWGLGTLLKINEKFGINDTRLPMWEDFLANLVPYPVDPQRGFMIGEGVNLTGSHRHYSHLLMIYPLHMVTDQMLIERSVAHWQSMPQWLQGYSFTGSSSIYSMMGDGERAVAQLRKLLDEFIQPNTLYKETGPVIETPLAGAASLQELYLQSWGGCVRVFPAVPESWPSASFVNFRTEGAFLVSATRREGRTVFLQIESERGGDCLLQTDMDLSRVRISRVSANSHGSRHGGKVPHTVLHGGQLKIPTRPGDVIQIRE